MTLDLNMFFRTIVLAFHLRKIIRVMATWSDMYKFYFIIYRLRYHFHNEDTDDGCLIQYYSVEVKFDQSRYASHRDQNLIEGMLGYVEKI